jgi:hypothetical protein
MAQIDDLLSHKYTLIREIEFLKTKLENHDTGHIRTAISVLEERVKEIDEFFDDVTKKSIHLMNGLVNWDKIMSTPGNL